MRVVILKDAWSPLHYLRCAVPCGHPDGDPWCQRWPFTKSERRGICWLGSAPTPEGCQVLAARWGDEVVKLPPEASPEA